MTQPAHRPDRQDFTVHAGAVEALAVLPEWWSALDSDVESRALRFSGENGVWVDDGDLPEALASAGCRHCEVVSVGNYGGITSPSLDVGRRVLLRPEPTNPYDPNAISVWLEDGSQQVGYVPKEVAAETSIEAQRRGSGYAAFVAKEQRDANSKERGGLAIVLGPGRVWASTQS
jgi:hypothetical protein